jgi:hypothetical protein
MVDRLIKAYTNGLAQGGRLNCNALRLQTCAVLNRFYCVAKQSAI